MAKGVSEDRAAGSRSGRTLVKLGVVAILCLGAGYLGKALIDSGRSGSLRLAVGRSTFALTLPDAEEAVDLATILAEAIPSVADSPNAADGAMVARRASSLALLQERHHLYEFGAVALIDRIRRLDPTTEPEYAEAFLDLVRNRQGPFRHVTFEEIPPPRSVEVVFWNGISQHFAAVCERSRLRNQWVRLVNPSNNEYLVLYASSVLVREDCPAGPDARIQINTDQARTLFAMADLPRSSTATVSLNPTEPPFQTTRSNLE